MNFRQVFSILICFLFASISFAQDTVKSILGPFMDDIYPYDGIYMSVSPDGNKIAIHGQILLVNEGRFINPRTKWGELRSPDLNYGFTNLYLYDGALRSETYSNYYHGFQPAQLPKSYVSFVSLTGKDEPFVIFKDSNFILGANNENQLLVSQPWYKDAKRKGLAGLWLADLKTGKRLKQLRKDTLVHDEWLKSDPRMGFNTSYTAFLRTEENSSGAIIIYPFNSDSVIKSGAMLEVREPFIADANYIYVPTRTGLKVYSLRTGKELYKTDIKPALSNPPYLYRPSFYAQGKNNNIYRYDREEKKLYEEQAGENGFTILQAWDMSTENLVFADDQKYKMAVANDRVLIAPMMRRIGNVPGNAAYLIDLRSGKVVLQIAPFFNPSEQLLANEAKAEKENKEYYARIEAERKNADAKKKAECDKKITDMGLKIGSTVQNKERTGLLRSYNCEKDLYTLWIPKSLLKTLEQGPNVTIEGWLFRHEWKKSQDIYKLCHVCKGEGTERKVVERSHTKEVPQGYFSGITTTVTRTWKETITVTCDQCKGDGVIK